MPRPGPQRRSCATAAGIDVEGEVDVGVGRGEPERQPQRPQPPAPWARPSPPARATAPSRRSRTTTPPTRTRRPGRAGTAAPRSRRPRCRRGPSPATLRSRGTVSTTPGHAGREPVDQPVAQRADPLDRRARPLGHRDAQRRGHGHDAGDVVGAAAALALLAAAEEQRLERHAVAHHERADTLGPAELVGADRDELGRRRAPAATSSHSERLHRVGVQHRARAPARRTTAATSASGWIVPTSLLASITDTTVTASSSASASCVEVDAAGARRRPRSARRGARPGAARRGARSAAHTATPPCAAHDAEDGEVVGLGAAAGEHDLAGPAAEALGHHVAGLVDRLAGVAGDARASPTGCRSAR